MRIGLQGTTVFALCFGLWACTKGESPEGTASANPAKPAPQPAAPPAKPAPAPSAVDPKLDEAVAAGNVETGKGLYNRICVTCHGPDGTGSMMRQAMPEIGDLTSPELHNRLSNADMAHQIEKGKNKMPPLGQMFKPDEIPHLIAYVRSLNKSGK